MADCSIKGIAISCVGCLVRVLWPRLQNLVLIFLINQAANTIYCCCVDLALTL